MPTPRVVLVSAGDTALTVSTPPRPVNEPLSFVDIDNTATTNAFTPPLPYRPRHISKSIAEMRRAHRP
ncbi:hypothetical protein BDN70DRAFT_888499 [Pholiota conissans]|uniref:Uncharacterized protein n=1 Tax=Pholiota conissans TaxID=109636 RepID=A0A9P5YLZ9_9AGAR|nr:hypothetical protein BDN70DRAFT_888499 [Pholiota conissans]